MRLEEYGWTTDLDTVKRQVDWQLGQLKTDYIDFGFIHCLDSAGDWEAYQKNGILDYLLEMKKRGVVRHIGLSSTRLSWPQIILDTGLVEQLMFSINPAYDYHHGNLPSEAPGSGWISTAAVRRRGIGDFRYEALFRRADA